MAMAAGTPRAGRVAVRALAVASVMHAAAVAAAAQVPADLERLARLLIEPLERTSSCRFIVDEVLAERPGARPGGRRFVLLALSYRGPEVQCQHGLEELNRVGAGYGLGFVANRLSLSATDGQP